MPNDNRPKRRSHEQSIEPSQRKKRGLALGAVIVVLAVEVVIGLVGHAPHAALPAHASMTAPVSAPMPQVLLRINPKDGAEMIGIPAGDFTMGEDIPPPSDEDEKPAHNVYLDTYHIYKNDVTVGMYRKFCVATGRKMPEAPVWGWDKSNYPIVNESWGDATAYARWAAATLPTEAQWEKAARGVDRREYPWGNDWRLTNCRNYVYTNEVAEPADVGSYSDDVSPYGVMDMAGNVWQWCSDWYDADYYSHSPLKNPKGPAGGDSHVLRGGAWNSYSENPFRTSYRYLDLPSQGASTNPVYSTSVDGFRCVSTSVK